MADTAATIDKVKIIARSAPLTTFLAMIRTRFPFSSDPVRTPALIETTAVAPRVVTSFTYVANLSTIRFTCGARCRCAVCTSALVWGTATVRRDRVAWLARAAPVGAMFAARGPFGRVASQADAYVYRTSEVRGEVKPAVARRASLAV